MAISQLKGDKAGDPLSLPLHCNGRCVKFLNPRGINNNLSVVLKLEGLMWRFTASNTRMTLSFLSRRT